MEKPSFETSLRKLRWKSTLQLAESLLKLKPEQSEHSSVPAIQGQSVEGLLRELNKLVPESSENPDPVSSCLVALRRIDEDLLNLLRESTESVLDNLESMSRDENSNSLELIKSVGKKIRNFLKVAGDRYLDCPVSSQREEVNNRVQLIKIFLPYLFYCIDGGSEETKTFILRNLETCISEILVIFEKNCVTKSKVGFLLNLMDQVLEDETTSDAELCNLVTEILRYGLQVSKICCAEDEDEISLVSRGLADRLENLKTCQPEEGSYLGTNADGVRDLVQVLEEKMNTGLLRVYCRTLGSVENPLETLVLEALNSTKEVELRSEQDLQSLVDRLDLQTDGVLNLCEYCSPCTRNLEYAATIQTSARIFQIVEPELVPAVLQMYLYPEKDEYRRMVRLLRQVWRLAQENLISTLKKIVDPTALSIIILIETKKIAKQIFENMYEQEPEILKNQILLLVGMCEMGVDLSWKELGGAQTNPLAETHPLVRTERAVWEVRAAAKILVSNTEDLELHKSLVKRIKILINYFSELSCFLVDQAQENRTLSSTGHFLEKKEPEERISFYSILNPEKNRILTQTLRRDMYRLTVDMSPYTPQPPRENPTSRIQTLRMERTPESSARLSSVLDQLSLLSHELSLNLEAGEEEESLVKGVQGEGAKPKPETGNISLRRRIFKSREFNLKPSLNYI